MFNLNGIIAFNRVPFWHQMSMTYELLAGKNDLNSIA